MAKRGHGFGQAGIQAGSPEPEAVTRRLVVPLLHPAAIVKDQWAKEPAQETYIKRTKDMDYVVTDVDDPPPGSVLFPSLRDLEAFRPKITSGVSIDLETCGDHIICAGLTVVDMDTYELGASLCLRFRVKGGGLYWRWDEHVKAVAWLYELLADETIAKVFWNGVTFDVPMFIKAGFEVRGRFVDGMLMMRAAYMEMPSGLQYTGTLFLGMPVWKTLVDEDEDEK